MFVATIDTRYGFVALADTYGRAEWLVASAALDWLLEGGDGPWWNHQNTVQDVIDYFSPTVTEVLPDSASMEGWIRGH
jgi:hypothetical protein